MIESDWQHSGDCTNGCIYRSSGFSCGIFNCDALMVFPFYSNTRSIVFPSHNVAGPCCSCHTVCQVYSVSSPLCTRSIVFPSLCVLGLQYSLYAVYSVHVVPFTLFTRSIVFPPHCVLGCLLYTSPSPRDAHRSRMPSSA